MRTDGYKLPKNKFRPKIRQRFLIIIAVKLLNSLHRAQGQKAALIEG